MERLTSYKNECKSEMICRYEECFTDEEHCPHLNEENCPCLQEILKKLAEYEDTGLAPEQIREMDKLYAEKCKELAEAKEIATDDIPKKLVRLTTDKNVSEMSMMELAHNCCYAKDRRARYRDYDSDIDARELAIKLLDRYANIPNKFACDEDFDDFMLDVLQYGFDNRIGLIAMFYQNLWAMADLRERLKYYEDLEEKREYLKLPCAVGDTVYEICEGFIEPCTVEVIFLADYKDKDGNYSYMMEIHYDREDCPWVSTEVYFTDIGKTVFLTKKEAQEALKKIK